MNKKMPLVLLAVVVAFIAGTMLTSTPTSTEVKDSVKYQATICACKNSGGVCYEGLSGAACKHNVLTNAGKEAIEVYLKTGGFTAFNYLALGNGTAPVAGDTTLNGETSVSGLTRATATVYDNGNGNWSLVKTWTAGASALSINSTAIFNQSSAGAMLAGGTFTSVNLETSDQLTINYTLAITT